jgi:3-hydroxyacyl-[acyl-carrier-protein] dehydratase
MSSSESRDQEVIQALKRCSPETVSAALRFQSTRQPEDLSIVVKGVLARELPEGGADRMAAATDDTRLTQDLGLDSYGMLELVMAAEEVLGITVADHEMRGIATLGDLKTFLQAKVEGAKSTLAGDPAAAS